jgi:hypothetical protein
VETIDVPRISRQKMEMNLTDQSIHPADSMIRLAAALAAVVIGYAFVLGLNPVQADDTFFLLNDARWVIQHHEISWTEHFSYSAQGESWVYPLGAGLLFYAAWLIGGFAALSYIGAAVTATTTALLLRKDSVTSVVLAVLAAVPISYRTGTMRADMFTVVLSAAFLRIVWGYHETGSGRLWMLPLLTVAWVNLHLGFLVGFALLATYIGTEIFEFPWPAQRRLATARLRRAWPWLLACVPVTLVSPYGPWVYMAVHDQLTSPVLARIQEWQSIPWGWSAALSSQYAPIYVTIILAIGLAVVALWRAQLGAAGVLLVAAGLGADSMRLCALASVVVTIIGTSVLPSRRTARAVIAATALVIAVAYFKLSSLAMAGQPLLAAGLSPMLPTRAFDFVEREQLPGPNILTNDLGAYLAWRLFPKYRELRDSRITPFGVTGFGNLVPPSYTDIDLNSWAARYHVNTILVVRPSPLLCNSENWATVYMDATAAIFVRRTPQTEDLIRRLRINCDAALRAKTNLTRAGSEALVGGIAIVADSIEGSDRGTPPPTNGGMVGQ